jgi:hypothetical protein
MICLLIILIVCCFLLLLHRSIDFMTNKLGTNVDILYGNIDKKDLVLGNLKTDLMSQMAEKRSREEEVNQGIIIHSLFSSIRTFEVDDVRGTKLTVFLLLSFFIFCLCRS